MGTANDSLSLQLQINLSYELNGMDKERIINMLERLPDLLANRGHFTDDSPAVVLTMDSNVHEWDLEEHGIRRAPSSPAAVQLLPTTHILVAGKPLCDFMPGTVPGEWPEGHVWARMEQRDEVVEDRQCVGCFRAQERPAQEKIGPVASEMLDTLMNEFDNSDWEFDGKEVQVAYTMGEQLIVKLVDGDAFVLRLHRYPAPNPKECDPGCPGWAVFNGHEIQRCDSCQRFNSDTQAITYVEMLQHLDIDRHSYPTEMRYLEDVKNDLEDLRDRYEKLGKEVGDGTETKVWADQVFDDLTELIDGFGAGLSGGWEDNYVQFPRLLAEMRAIGEVSDDTETMTKEGYYSVKIKELCESMDLPWTRIEELFERADYVWELDKMKTFARRDT